jgi:hypothetical protein
MRLRGSAKHEPRSQMRLGAHVALVLIAALVSAVTIGVLLWWLLGRPPLRQAGGWTTANSFEFAKIVLALIGGVGAVVALVIAYRKQHLGEAAEQREDIKLFAERFTKASDQLGSDKAPVRLAGMYALEDLAQGTPSQRQTIVNVLCAYLRMPYEPPVPCDAISGGPGESVTSPSTDENVDAEFPQRIDQLENEYRYQEHQVRLTAQRILASHLRPGTTSQRPVDTFWKNIDVDLTGATLLDLDFSQCHIRTARFNRAVFGGDAWFYEAEFGEDAWFYGAEFRGFAVLEGVVFCGNAVFERAMFGRAGFDAAEFGGHAWFNAADFGGFAGFSEAKFGGQVGFSGAQFYTGARFDGATFSEDPEFREASVRLDVHRPFERTWPDGLVVVEPFTEDEAPLPHEAGRWGYLRTTTSSEATLDEPLA